MQKPFFDSHKDTTIGCPNKSSVFSMSLCEKRKTITCFEVTVIGVPAKSSGRSALLSAFIRISTAEFAIDFEINAVGKSTNRTVAEGEIRYSGMKRTETADEKLSR